MSGESYRTTQEIVIAARRKSSDEIWSFVTGGAASENTMSRNRQAIDRYAFRPRVLVDVHKIDTATTLLGHPLRLPVVTAPIGNPEGVAAGGAAAVPKACHARGTICFVSSMSDVPFDQIAGYTPSPKFYQIYVRGDWDWVEERLHQVKQAGYAALAVTVDSAYYGRRERQMSRGYAPRRNMEIGREFQSRLSWDSLDRIREGWGGKLILKGVGTAEDALIALGHGVDAIYVSNHGGRQLDQCLGTLDMLAEIAEAVAGRVELMVDGGFVRGADVIKAIALGATAVGIGKLQGWALMAGGEAAMTRALEILEEEIRNIMGLIGVTGIREIGPTLLKQVPVNAAVDELSAFPHLPAWVRDKALPVPERE